MNQQGEININHASNFCWSLHEYGDRINLFPEDFDGLPFVHILPATTKVNLKIPLNKHIVDALQEHGKEVKCEENSAINLSFPLLYAPIGFYCDNAVDPSSPTYVGVRIRVPPGDIRSDPILVGYFVSENMLRGLKYLVDDISELSNKPIQSEPTEEIEESLTKKVSKGFRSLFGRSNETPKPVVLSDVQKAYRAIINKMGNGAPILGNHLSTTGGPLYKLEYFNEIKENIGRVLLNHVILQHHSGQLGNVMRVRNMQLPSY